MTRKRLVAATAFAVLVVASPALAVTGGDVLDRMTEKEQIGYVTGAIDMAMYRASVQEKNNAKSECILKWYYQSDGKGPREVIATFGRYKDKPAVGLIDVLINRACGQ